MRLEPKITFEQYKATLVAVRSAKPKKSHMRSGRYYIILAIVCLAIGIAAQSPVTRIPIFTVVFALFFLSILAKPLTRRSREKCLKRLYQEEQAGLKDQVFTIDESGISCNWGNGKTVTHMTWQAFTSSIDMPDATIFLLSPNRFVRVPKESLTPSDQDQIRKWSAAIPPVPGN
jgi:hypothetical protein